MLVPVLRNVAQPVCVFVSYALVRHVLTAKGYMPRRGLAKTRESVYKLCLPVAVDAGDADDLAAAHIEGHAAHGVLLMQLTVDGEPLDLEHRLAGDGRLFIDDELDISADHHVRKLFLCRLGGVYRSDAPALAQYGAAVRDSHYLVELVRYEKYRLSLGGKPAHYVHQLLDLLRCENSRRLVEDEYLVLAVEHFKYLGALLHTDGDVLYLCVGIDTETV